MNKKYLFVGTLIALSFAVFAPKFFVPQVHAIANCSPDTCVAPDGFTCDNTTGVCGADSPGDYTKKAACKATCKPITTIDSLAPNKGFLPVYTNELITVKWSTANMASDDKRCSGYVDEASVASTLPATSQISNLSWGTAGTHTVGVQCTNDSGQGNFVTSTILISERPVDPSLSVSASPAAGNISLSGTVSYSLTRNDSRPFSEFTCGRWSSPAVPGWANGTPATLNDSGTGSDSYGPITSAGTYTVGIGCFDSNSVSVGSAAASITASAYSGPQHYGCQTNNSCALVDSDGLDSCDSRFNCNTGSLTLTPTNGLVGVGATSSYSAWYTNGAVTDRIGAMGGLGIDSSNFSVIKRTSADALTATLTASAVGTAQVSASYQGLVATTPVTVTSTPHNVTLTINPNSFGATSETATVQIRGGKPSSWGALARTAYEYDNYPTVRETFGQPNPQWQSTDASGNTDSSTLHQCINDDGTKPLGESGHPIKGYREEVQTRVSFDSWGQSTPFIATKDCRGTVQITYKNGNTGNWSMSGPTVASSSNYSTANHVSDPPPGLNDVVQNGTSGSDTFVSYKATDGTYNISTSCTIQGGISSLSISPGTTANFILICPSGGSGSHKACSGTTCTVVSGGGTDSCTSDAQCTNPYSCTGSIPSGNSECSGTGANLTVDRSYKEVSTCSVDQNDKCEYFPTPIPLGSSCSSITAPSTVAVGQDFNATVVMTNTGSNTWTTPGPNPYRLGTWDPMDNKKWLPVGHLPGQNRVDLPAGASIAPGQSVSFNFNASTSYTPGVRKFSWKMVREGDKWFPDVGGICTKNITVTAISCSPGSPSQACTSAPNSCGQTNIGTQTRTCNSGTWGAWGACSAVTPPDSACSSLSVSLSVNPNSGQSPLTSILTANVSGSAVGTINYKFWKDCNNPTTNLAAATTACGAPTAYDSSAENPKTTQFTYDSIGTYHPKVLVERASALNAQATTTITVTAGCSAGQTNPYYTCSGNTCAQVNSCGTNSGGCNSGNVGSLCGGYSCQGSIPSGYSGCSGTGANLTQNRNYTAVSTCNSNQNDKCEYYYTGIGVQHSECVAVGQSNVCKLVDNTPGNIANRCTGDPDCNKPPDFYGACDNSSGAWTCVNTAGTPPPGFLTCGKDSDCGGVRFSYLACLNSSCAIVGADRSTPNDPGCAAGIVGQTCSACSITATPTLINVGGSSKLTWSCVSGVSGCTLTTKGAVANSGNTSVTPAKSTTYTLNCTKGGAPISTSVDVKVLNLQECNPNDPTCKPKP